MLRRLWLIVVAGVLLGGAWLWLVRDREGPPPNVLLIMVDTCRADRLGCNGCRLPDGSSPTPHLDALARQGTLLRVGLSPVPMTLPATVSIMTGLYPDGHGIRENDSFRLLPPAERDYSLLAEDLKKGGFETAAFISGQPLEHASGLNQGFSLYEEPDPERRIQRYDQFRERSARETTQAVVNYLKQTAKKPLFIFVHYFDPHMPYEERFRLKSQPRDPVERAYLSEIAFVDQQAGLLLKALPEGGKHWLVMVVGDHGEGRGEHEEASHAYLLHDSTLRVPFLMRLPEGMKSKLSLSVPPRLVDIYPTVLRLCNVRSMKRPVRDGRVLLDPPGTDWSARAETLYDYYQFGFSRIRSFRNRHYKLEESGGREELFNWRADPGETHNLWDSQRAVGQRLLDQLYASLQDRQAAPAGNREVTPDAATPYMGIRPRGLPVEPGEDENARLPKTTDHFDVIHALDRARALIRRGEYGQAALLLETHRPQSSRNPSLLFWAGRAHQRCAELKKLSFQAKLRHLRRARMLFEEAVERFDLTRARDSILRVLMWRARLSDLEGKRQRERDPKRGQALVQKGREALLAILRQVAGRRGSSLTLTALATKGQALELLGDEAGALASFEEALKREPRHPLLQRDIRRLRDLLSKRGRD